MKILSLFDGMACGMIAMLECNVDVERYVAFEIDKYAIKTSSHNFPNIEHKGDVFDADFTEYQGFDFLVGGSPCTYWSIAQKNGRETEASGMGWELFQQYVRALREAKPKYFIYENNKSMSKAIRASIDETFGFEAVLINSALVSAQNRQRLYWVGKRNADGTYSKVDVEQPEDRGILLKDVLDGNITGTVTNTKNHKTNRLGGLYGQVTRWGIYGTDGKTPTLTAAMGMGGGHIPMITEPIRVGSLPRPNGELSTSQAMRVYSTDGKSVNLTSGGGGMGGKTGLYAIPVEFDGTVPTKAISQADGKTYRVYKVENGIINIKGKDYPIKLADGYYIIRKLTVRECMRLQTIPEWYEFPVSDAQAYKQIGNGWTCEVITHLIKSCLAGKVDDFAEQIKFF